MRKFSVILLVLVLLVGMFVADAFGKKGRGSRYCDYITSLTLTYHDPGGHATIDVEVKGNADPTSFSEIGDGDTFTVNGTKGHGEGKFGKKTTFKLYDPGADAPFETHKIHTSCSQPLAPGDRFGALEITYKKEDEVNEAPTIADLSANNVNEGGTSTLTATIADVDNATLDVSVDWGDGSAVESFANQHINSFQTTHVYADDDADDTYTITMTVEDAEPLSAAATYDVTVTNVNPASLALTPLTGTEDIAYSGTLSATDVVGDPLSWAKTGGAGWITVAADGSVSGTPTNDDTGDQTLNVEVTDGDGGSSTASFTIAITPVNDAPVAANVDGSGDEGAAITTVLSASDVDASEPSTFTFTIVSSPANIDGEVSIGAVSYDAGTFTATATYTHDGSETTSDSFTYNANDGSDDSNTATVTITVTPVNDAPVAVADSYSMDEDTKLKKLTVPANDDVLSNDTDEDGDRLTATLDTDVSKGTLTLRANGTFTYTPYDNFNGTDSFSYKANDGTADSNTVTVNITITPVNDAPVVTGIPGQTVNEDTLFTTINLDDYVNDVDNTDAAMSWTYSGETDLTVNIVNRVATITYPPGWNDSETITFNASDGEFSGDDPAIFTVNNLAPTVDLQSVTTAEDTAKGITLTGSDPGSSDPLTYSIVSNPSHGTLAGTLPNLTYTPTVNYNGLDSFEFKVNDGDVDSNTATVNITVTPVNDAPVAVADSYSTDEDTKLTVPANDGVLSNDTDEDGDRLTATLDTDVSKGTLTLRANGTFTYTPDDNFNGTDSFSYKANDGTADSNTVTVNITVTPVNDAPVASDDTFYVYEDAANGTVVDTVSATDPDSEDVLTYAITAGNTDNIFTIDSGTGEITVADNTNLDYETTTSYALTVEVTDSGGLSDTAIVAVDVDDVNKAPTVDNQGFSVSEDATDRTSVGTVSATDPDSEDVLTYAITAGNTDNIFTIDSGTGEITVADNTNLDYETTTSYALMVEVTDTSGALSDTATVTVDVVDVVEVTEGVGGGEGEGAGGTIAMITSPPDGLLTEKSERIVTYEIHGEDLSSATFLHNGEETAIAAESGSITITLVPGENILEVRATNSAGTTASSGKIRVRYVPPPLEVIITNPPAMAFAGEGGTFVIVASVEVTGTVSDRAITEATLILGGTDRTIIPVDNGYFEHELTLEKEGLNTIRVEAADAQGNTASSGTVGVIYVSEKLSVEVEHPSDGDITNSEACVVYGSIIHGAAVTTTTLYANGVAKEIVLTLESPEGGRYTYSFNETITLREGENTFAVEGIDEFGNSGSSGTISVTLDTTAPEVAITTPATGYLTNQDKVLVAGTVDDPAVSQITLNVNGTEQTITVTGGFFSGEISLTEGMNTIEASAVDPLGNEGSSETVVVTYNRAAPAVSITSPSGGTKTNLTSVVVDYTIAAAATSAEFILNGDSEGIPPESGSRTVSLVEGPNTIEVRASDGTITASSGVVRIVSDTTAPSMSVDVSEPWKTVLITVYSDEALSSPPTVEVTGGSSTGVEMALTGVREWTGSYEIPEDGSYTVNVMGTDEAGNMGSYTTSFSRESVSAAPGDTITVVSERLRLDIEVGEAISDQSISTVRRYEDPKLGRTTEPAIFVRVKMGVPLRWAMTSMTIKAFYDPAELSEGMNETTLKLYLWTPSKGGWSLVEGATVDPSEHSITGSVTY